MLCHYLVSLSKRLELYEQVALIDIGIVFALYWSQSRLHLPRKLQFPRQGL
jgi:hypothetical protein